VEPESGDPATLPGTVIVRGTVRFLRPHPPTRWGRGDRGSRFDGRPRRPLCGKPISEWSFNAGTSVATGGTLCIGGDFNAGYVIADRLGLTAVPIPALFSGATAGSFGYPTGQSGLAVWGRTGAGVVNANALRVLVAR
jgi:hypothetical protein